MKTTICRGRRPRRPVKRIVSIILSICMLLSLTAGLDFSAYADDLPSSGLCGDNVTYTFDSATGTLTISGIGPMSDYYSEPESPFYNQSSIKKVIINNGVTRIGYSAFSGCTGLTSITIPDSVTSIGDSAFYDCTGLTNAIIGNSVTSIGYDAFYGCTGLKELTMPCSAFVFTGETFELCENIEKITLTKGTGVMPDYFLDNAPFSRIGKNDNINIIIENGVENIGKYAFYGCTGLTSITIPDSVTSIGDSAFYDCSSLTSVTIPDSVTSIGESAFCNCSSLTSVTIPDSVTSIGWLAFNNCSELTEVSVPCSVSVGSDDFAGCYNLETLTLTKGTGVMVDNYGYDDSFVANFSNIVIENGVENIGKYAFYGCTGLTSITIPDSVTSIGDSAFYDCTSLKSVTIPDSVTSIGDSAFCNCSSLTSVTIPDSVTSIGACAFSECSSLTSITIPGSVAIISDNAFSCCSDLASVTIEYGVTSIGDYAFDNCEGLTSITIPDSVTSIGACAFFECSSLTSITIPNSVTSIDSHAFSRSGIKDITIPASVINIGEYAFEETSKLSNVTIENGVKSIGDYAFSECTDLLSVTIPESVTHIGYCAFQKCESWTNIYIYNKDCDIFDSPKTLYKSTIHGYKDSTAQTLAEKYNLSFVAIYNEECVEHVPVTYPAKEPTCTATGLTEGSHCSVCGAIIVPQEVIAANGHNFNSVITYPTCLQKGYTTYTCSVCGESYRSDYTDALTEHNYESITTKPASCTSKGIKTYICTNCDDRYTEEIPMLKHTPVTDAAIAPTCVKAGLTEGSHCSACGEILVAQQVVNSTGHMYASIVIKQASCTSKGIVKYICSTCGDTYTTELDMTAHTSVNDKAIAPTCTKSGLTEGSHCSVCGTTLVEQEVVKAKGHTYTSVVTAPTCKEQGYTTYTCKDCGDSYKADFTAVTANHDYKATVTTPATCTAKGVKTFTCSICGDKYTEDVDMLEHTAVTDKAVAATCTKAGLTEGSHCSVCDAVIVEQTVIPANQHQYNSVVTAPTCRDKGYTTYTCSVCQDSYRADYTDRTNDHDYNGVVTKLPTCTADGVKTFTCSVCGDTYTEPVEKIAHTPAAAIKENEKAATCTAKGSYDSVVYCSECHTELSRKTKTLDLIAHTPVTDATVAPTGTSTGLTEGSHCSVCGEILVAQKVVPALIPEGASVKVNGDKAVITLSDGSTITVPKDTKETVKNADGTYTVTLNDGKSVTVSSNTEVTKTADGQLNVKATKIGAAKLSKVKKGKKSFTATWKSVANVDGYEIQYSLKKNMKKAKTKSVASSKKKLKVKKLKAKKKYYVRIRAYKVINGKKQYSAWSAKKKVKTK